MRRDRARDDPRRPQARTRASRRQRVVVLVIAGLGSLAVVGMSVGLVLGGLRTRSLTRPVPGGLEVTGTVVDIYAHQYKQVVYGPVVAFTDSAGQRHTFRAPTSTNRPTIGAPALVSYDPTRPGVAHDLSDSSGSWKWPLYTGAMLLSFISVEGFVVGFFLVRRRRRRSARM